MLAALLSQWTVQELQFRNGASCGMIHMEKLIPSAPNSFHRYSPEALMWKQAE